MSGDGTVVMSAIFGVLQDKDIPVFLLFLIGPVILFLALRKLKIWPEQKHYSAQMMFLVFLIAFLIYRSIGPLPNFDPLGESQKNINKVAVVLKMYAADHRGNLPATLAQTVPRYAIGSALFLAKYRLQDEPWIYYSGHREGDEVVTATIPITEAPEASWLSSSGQQKAVIVRSPARWKNVWLVVFSDFTTGVVPDDEFKKLRMDDSNPPAAPVRVQEQQR